jgi:DNA-binding NarL/FixJ family response regulator
MQTQTPYQVVLADDHEPFRRGLKKILKDDCQLEVVGEACDGCELLKCLNMIKSIPQLAIIDITMPNLGGIDLTARIKKDYPNMKVLILSGHKDKEYVQGAMAAGANGYLMKADAAEELFAAIQKVRQGEIYLSPQMSERSGQ